MTAICDTNLDSTCQQATPAIDQLANLAEQTQAGQTQAVVTYTSASNPSTVVYSVVTEPPASQSLSADPSGTLEPVQIVHNSSSNGVSNGAVAGIAIATCVLGAAIASLVAFLLFKKRGKKTNTGLTASAARFSYADSSPELVVEAKNATQSPYTRVLHAPLPGPIPESVHPMPASNSILAFLPSAVDGTAVQNRVLALFDQVYRHVDVYYRDVHASITPSMEPDLARFGTRDVDMAELLHICARPTVALKHALGAWVLGITGPKRDHEQSVFPEPLQRSRMELSAATGMFILGFKNPILYATLTASTDPPTTLIAKSLHRRLSAYIYTSSLSSQLPHSSSRASLVPRTSAAMREAAEHFSLTFFPWGNPSSRDVEREEDLLMILSEALDLQVWLFGQPDEWVFEWGSADRGVVVRPGLQRVDEAGESKMVIERDVVAV
jgi:hypothetical protein